MKYLILAIIYLFALKLLQINLGFDDMLIWALALLLAHNTMHQLKESK